MRELSADEINEVTGGIAISIFEISIGALAGGAEHMMGDGWTWGDVIAHGAAGAAIVVLASAGPVGVVIGVAGGVAVAWAQNHSNNHIGTYNINHISWGGITTRAYPHANQH
jgi:hypothetical protein